MVPVRIEVLGPLRLLVDGAPVDVPGPRRRAVLALLAVAGGRVIPTESLIDALWPDDPPDTAHRALHSHLSRLRRHLGTASGRLERAGAGYALRVGPDDVDAARLRALARRSSAQLTVDPAAASTAAEEALGLWRGPVLAEFADVAPLAAEAVGLRELLRQVRDDALEARLALGDGAVTADAVAAAAEEPLRERTVLLLLRCLARDGRAGDALAEGAAYRRRIVAETGLDAGPAVAALEQRIAAGDLAPRDAPAAAPAPASGTAPAPAPGTAPVAAPGPRAVRAPAPGAASADAGAPPAHGPAGAPQQAAGGTAGPRRWTVARPGGPLIGRDQDAEELRRLLRTQRLVTVAGPGGVGKTRLSLDVAADTAERGSDVALVALAEVTDDARVADAVATALRLRIGGDPLPDTVADALAERPLLLVLDNCEHVVEACRDLTAALLTRAPGVRVLATSRVTLHVPGEYVVRLQPLPLPRAAAAFGELTHQASVRAFVEHARRRDPSFTLGPGDADDVAEVLRRLDGLPLAIELAAGQVAVLPPAALRERLGRALDALSADRPASDARHRTLRTTIDWSYRLLTEHERALLRALAGYPGGADLRTVEDLAARSAPGSDPLVPLGRLVDASLITPDDHGGERRYRILETVRGFLLEDAAARGEREDAERAFLRWARRTARTLGAGLDGQDEEIWDRRLRAELGNLRAARDLALARGDLDVVVDVTLALDEAAVLRDIEELWHWSVELADEPALRGHPCEAAVLGSAAEAAWLVGDLPRADRFRAAALDAVRLSGDPEAQRRCWSSAAAVALFAGRFDEARARWTAAADVAARPAVYLASAALAAAYGGDRAGALELVARALEARPGVSHGAFSHYAQGEALAAGDPGAAAAAYARAIEAARSAGAGFVEGVARVGLASVEASTGDPDAAARGYRDLLDYWDRTGNATQLWTTIRNVARLLITVPRPGGDADAALLLAAAESAPSASRLTGADADRAARDRAVLAGRLGADVTAVLETRARTLTPADASATARRALDRLRATPEPT